MLAGRYPLVCLQDSAMAIVPDLLANPELAHLAPDIYCRLLSTVGARTYTGAFVFSLSRQVTMAGMTCHIAFQGNFMLSSRELKDQ